MQKRCRTAGTKIVTLETQLKDKFTTAFKEVRQAFRAADADKNGEIDVRELRQVLARFNLHPEAAEMDKLLASLGMERTGAINYQRFMKHFGEAIQGKENESILPGIHKPQAVRRAAAAPSISAAQGRKFLANKLAMRHNKVREAFREMDLDHNMQLDGNELRGCLERYGFAINATEFKLLMKQIDKNGDGKIDVAEFTSQFGDAVLPMEGDEGMGFVLQQKAPLRRRANQARQQHANQQARLIRLPVDEVFQLLKQKMAAQHKQVRAAFRMFDTDGDGFVSKSELARVLSRYAIDVPEKHLMQIVSKVDTNNDGRIDYREFMQGFGCAIQPQQAPSSILPQQPAEPLARGKRRGQRRASLPEPPVGGKNNAFTRRPSLPEIRMPRGQVA